jgi:hypothetical protein
MKSHNTTNESLAAQTPAEGKFKNRKEFGLAVFNHAKAEIEVRGFSLVAGNFDPNYPVSLRTLRAIKRGIFTFQTILKIPGIQAEEWFVLVE